MHISPTTRLRHDLRTHINHILGYAQLLLEDVESEEGTPGWIEPIRQAAALGRGLFKTIDVQLPAAEASLTEERVRDLQSAMDEPVRQLHRIILEVPLRPEAPQAADIQRLAQATSKLLAFVTTGAFDTQSPPPGNKDPQLAPEEPHLLLIGGDPASRDSVSGLLPPLNYGLSVAISADEATRLLQHHRYDLILLDISVRTALTHIVQLAKGQPVILISGTTDMPTVRHCLATGAEDYVLKPIDPASLTDRISTALLRRRHRETTLANTPPHSPGRPGEDTCRAIQGHLNPLLAAALAAGNALDSLRHTLSDQQSRNIVTDLSDSLSLITEHATGAKRLIEDRFC